MSTDRDVTRIVRVVAGGGRHDAPGPRPGRRARPASGHPTAPRPTAGVEVEHHDNPDPSSPPQRPPSASSPSSSASCQGPPAPVARTSWRARRPRPSPAPLTGSDRTVGGRDLLRDCRVAGRSGPSPCLTDGRSSTRSSGRTSMDRARYDDVGGPGEVAIGWWSRRQRVRRSMSLEGLARRSTGGTDRRRSRDRASLEQVGRDGVGPTDVIFGGYPAKRVELSMPADLDVATCDEGQYACSWMPVSRSRSPTPPGRTWAACSRCCTSSTSMARGVMQTLAPRRQLEADLAELEAMLASIRIDPPAPSPSPSPSPSAAG